MPCEGHILSVEFLWWHTKVWSSSHFNRTRFGDTGLMTVNTGYELTMMECRVNAWKLRIWQTAWKMIWHCGTSMRRQCL